MTARKLQLAIFASLLIGPVLAASAATAMVKDIRGNVNVRVASGAWAPARAGMQFDTGDTISTGFNSTAVLTIGLTTITVQQLTRMRLDELVQKQGKLTTSFTLPIGRVQAHVKSADGSPQDFRIHSPVSTAAVRGTEFTFDGYSLEVTDGVVRYINRVGQTQDVQHGQQSETDGENSPSNPENNYSSNSGTELPGTPSGVTGGSTGGGVMSGSIVVSW
jgi:hypothetical protein